MMQSYRSERLGAICAHAQLQRAGRRGEIINLLDTRINGYDWGHVGYIAEQAPAGGVHADDRAGLRAGYHRECRGARIDPAAVRSNRTTISTSWPDTVPLQRHGEPEDVADAIIYLLTSTFCTGNIIYVDGGRHLKEHANGRSYFH